MITVNGGCTIAELLLKDKTALQTLEYVNYVFVATYMYIVEAILKVHVLMILMRSICASAGCVHVSLLHL